MKKLPIDKMLCALERRADLLGVDIDKNSDYILICEAVSAFEFSSLISYELKEQIYFRLQKLFNELNLDFGMAMAKILMGE